jgi:hypothetical protein
MVSKLDPSVKFLLQQHLVYSNNKSQSSILKIGTKEQLSTAVKIAASTTIDEYQGPSYYPSLSKRSCLVACVDNWLYEKVYAVYTSEQIQEMDGQRNSGQVKNIYWRVMEMSEEVEKELLQHVDLETGMILTTLDAIQKETKSKEQNNK